MYVAELHVVVRRRGNFLAEWQETRPVGSIGSDPILEHRVVPSVRYQNTRKPDVQRGGAERIDPAGRLRTRSVCRRQCIIAELLAFGAVEREQLLQVGIVPGCIFILVDTLILRRIVIGFRAARRSEGACDSVRRVIAESCAEPGGHISIGIVNGVAELVRRRVYRNRRRCPVQHLRRQIAEPVILISLRPGGRSAPAVRRRTGGDQSLQRIVLID